MTSSRPSILLALVAAFACATLPARAAVVTRTGTFKVQSTVALSANVPSSATVSATASAYFYDPVGGSHQAQISATVKRSGNKANVMLTLPYRWAVGQVTGTVTVALSVHADAVGSPFATISGTIPLPAEGATTQVVLPASL
jgi:hypothetical protein